MFTPRTRRPEVTRAQIIEAAIRTAHEEGAAGFTLDAVVARLPFSKGALLHHFPNKLALLEGVVEHLGQDFGEKIRERVAKDPNPYVPHARAYLQATIDEVDAPDYASVSRAVLVACLLEPSIAERWQAHVARIRADDPTEPAAADDALILRLVADGLWLNDIMGGHPISPDQRRALTQILCPNLPASGAAA